MWLENEEDVKGKKGEKVVTNVENDSINNDKDYKIGDDKKKVDKKGKKIILGHVENELEKVNGKLKCYNWLISNHFNVKILFKINISSFNDEMLICNIIFHHVFVEMVYMIDITSF